MTMPPDVAVPYAIPAAEVLTALHSDCHCGLSLVEARARLSQVGRNELPAAPPPPRWRRPVAQVRSPLVLLLLAATAISLAVWWYEGAAHAPYEALAILHKERRVDARHQGRTRRTTRALRARANRAVDAALTDARRTQILHWIEELAADALRTLGFAVALFPRQCRTRCKASVIWFG